MTDLKKLDVSLTKHGAHKIALLLRKYDKDEILNHIFGQEPGINIELAQAKKNLSVGRGNIVPELWNTARSMGPRAIDALVLTAIIFSHHKLIDAMASGKTAPFRGRITRSKQLDGKAYTNFAHTLEELGYSTFHSAESVAYDLQPLFDIAGLNGLVLDLLTLKTRAAGWNGRGDVVDEFISNGLHAALALSPDQFSSWLRKGRLVAEHAVLEDPSFFSGADEVSRATPFKFVPGHNPRKTGKVGVSVAAGEITASLLHNEMQTALFKKLAKQYGKECVGTEVPTGQGTAIDLVVKTNSFCWFYEIKIADSVRACIRQAIPQLLEYAYWGGETAVAHKLIVIAGFPLTAQAEQYLKLLRKRFKLPLYYERLILPSLDPRSR